MERRSNGYRTVELSSSVLERRAALAVSFTVFREPITNMRRTASHAG